MGAPKPSKPVGDKLTDKAASKAEKLHAKAEKLHTTVDRISAKAKVQAESLERLAARLESVELWMRDEPGQRQARFTRSELAQTAIRIVDAEGLDALSMRRLAAELGAGTMTLYHYVRTKDELLTLVSDEVMAEVLLPEGYELPERLAGGDRRRGLALPGRDAPPPVGLRPERRPGPGAQQRQAHGPDAPGRRRHRRAARHQARRRRGDRRVRLRLLPAGAQRWTSDDQRDAASALRRGSRAHAASSRSCSATSTSIGLDALWQAFEDNGADGGRFERNLRRFIRGIEMDLSG